MKKATSKKLFKTPSPSKETMTDFGVDAAATEKFQPRTTNPLQSITDPLAEKLKLTKSVGLLEAVGILTGIVVGSGIFVSPQFVILEVGSPMMSLLVWFFCGIYSTLGALCYAELGVMIPRSGGDYIYIYEAFGSLPAFIFLWIALVVINPIAFALISLFFGNYLISEYFGNDDIPYLIPRLLSFCLISALVCLNCYKSRWSQLLNTFCMIIKIITMILIVFATIIYLFQGKSETMTKANWIDNGKYNPSALAMAFYSGIFSFAGYNCLNFITEEMKNVEKNLPRVIYISMPLITLIYVILNACYFVAIPAGAFLTVKAVAFNFAERTMGWSRYIVPIGVCVSCIGSVNGLLFAASRMFFAGARGGQLPELFSMINLNSQNPIPSLIVLGMLGVIFSFNPKPVDLISLQCFAVSFATTMSIMALLKMRLWDKRCPNRSLKIFIGIPVVFLTLCVYILVAPFFKAPVLLVFASGLILSSIPVYLVFVYWINKPIWFIRSWSKPNDDYVKQ